MLLVILLQIWLWPIMLQFVLLATTMLVAFAAFNSFSTTINSMRTIYDDSYD